MLNAAVVLHGAWYEMSMNRCISVQLPTCTYILYSIYFTIFIMMLYIPYENIKWLLIQSCCLTIACSIGFVNNT